MRLIDSNDLWSDIMMLPHNGDMISSKEVEQAIMEATTVDAVEVVRCKVCKHCNNFENWNKREYFGCCRIPSEVCEVEAEHFCSYGERRGKDEVD